jgi:hypothetical protein
MLDREQQASYQWFHRMEEVGAERASTVGNCFCPHFAHNRVSSAAIAVIWMRSRNAEFRGFRHHAKVA